MFKSSACSASTVPFHTHLWTLKIMILFDLVYFQAKSLFRRIFPESGPFFRHFQVGKFGELDSNFLMFFIKFSGKT